jgi:hypothetical protein
MPNYSTGFQAHLQGVNRADPELILLEISHADLATPIRVCNDTQDLTSGGNLYVAMPFEFTLPDDSGDNPRAELVMANVGRELMAPLEAAGGGQGATCRVRVVRRSLPNNYEIDITVVLGVVIADPLTVRAQLGYDLLLDWAAVGIRYDPVTAPGLF